MPTKAPTPCSRCGKKATYRGLCPKHANQAERLRGSSTERGYGAEHRALREWWKARIATGMVVCAREGCGKVIQPDDTWELGHIDGTKRAGQPRYAGPECRSCNRATYGRPN